MIGLDAAFSEYWENGTPCREALRFFLTQRPAGDACSAANYELILDGDAVTLKDSVSPEKLAEIFSSDFLLTCGAFFFYPAQAAGGPLGGLSGQPLPGGRSGPRCGILRDLLERRTVFTEVPDVPKPNGARCRGGNYRREQSIS